MVKIYATDPRNPHTTDTLSNPENPLLFSFRLSSHVPWLYIQDFSPDEFSDRCLPSDFTSLHFFLLFVLPPPSLSLSLSLNAYERVQWSNHNCEIGTDNPHSSYCLAGPHMRLLTLTSLCLSSTMHPTNSPIVFTNSLASGVFGVTCSTPY